MDTSDGPTIATVIPVLNEALHIESCLNGLLNQTIPEASHIILVMDGGSTDGTIPLVESLIEQAKATSKPRIELHHNPGKTVAHGRNLSLSLLPDSIDFIIEMIGHATIEPNHIQQRLDAWNTSEHKAGTSLAGVGCRVVQRKGEVHGSERWIEGCISSPFGHSDGQFSQFTENGPTRIPAFVMHRRKCLEEVNGWDERFITSQDSELSMRLLDAGYSLYRSPEPTVSMVKRTSLKQWWRMGHRYGFWRTKVLLKHPKRTNMVEFLPFFGLLLLTALFIGGLEMWWLPIPVYSVVLMIEGIRYGIRTGSMSSCIGVPLCLVMLHTSFTLGLADGLVRKGRPPKDRK